VRAHVDYECGEDAAGLAWLGDWVYGYSRDGIMHGHLHWHLTLAALALGDGARAWSLYEAQVRGAWGPPLNLVTDASSFLLRAEFCGMPAPEGAWRALAAVAAELYPQTGVAFADAHVALAFAMAGDEAGLARVRDTARGPAADVVAGLARAFDAYARRDDRAVLEHLLALLPEHERIGGSRAQRDLLEQLAVVAQRRGAVAGAESGARLSAASMVALRRHRRDRPGRPSRFPACAAQLPTRPRHLRGFCCRCSSLRHRPLFATAWVPPRPTKNRAHRQAPSLGRSLPINEVAPPPCTAPLRRAPRRRRLY
jgi:hypothetical protein